MQGLNLEKDRKFIAQNLSDVYIKYSDKKNNKYQIIHANQLSDNNNYNFGEICYQNNSQNCQFKEDIKLNYNDLEKFWLNNPNLFLYHILKNKDFYEFIEHLYKFQNMKNINHENKDSNPWILLSLLAMLVLIMQLFYIVL